MANKNTHSVGPKQPYNKKHTSAGYSSSCLERSSSEPFGLNISDVGPEKCSNPYLFINNRRPRIEQTQKHFVSKESEINTHTRSSTVESNNAHRIPDDISNTSPIMDCGNRTAGGGQFYRGGVRGKTAIRKNDISHDLESNDSSNYQMISDCGYRRARGGRFYKGGVGGMTAVRRNDISHNVGLSNKAHMIPDDISHASPISDCVYRRAKGGRYYRGGVRGIRAERKNDISHDLESNDSSNCKVISDAFSQPSSERSFRNPRGGQAFKVDKGKSALGKRGSISNKKGSKGSVKLHEANSNLIHQRILQQSVCHKSNQQKQAAENLIIQHELIKKELEKIVALKNELMLEANAKSKKNLEDISEKIEKLAPKAKVKYINLDDYERITKERDILEKKKTEILNQFVEFQLQITNIESELNHLDNELNEDIIIPFEDSLSLQNEQILLSEPMDSNHDKTSSNDLISTMSKSTDKHLLGSIENLEPLKLDNPNTVETLKDSNNEESHMLIQHEDIISLHEDLFEVKSDTNLELPQLFPSCTKSSDKEEAHEIISVSLNKSFPLSDVTDDSLSQTLSEAPNSDTSLFPYRSLCADLENLPHINSNSSDPKMMKNDHKFSLDQVKCLFKKREANLKELKRRILRESVRLKQGLPMLAHRDEIIQLTRKNPVTIIMAETGSGKSTQLVQYLAETESISEKIIVCTQPRKLAAQSLAERVASEFGCRTGEEVGFITSLSNPKVGMKTKIVFMTDYTLLEQIKTNKSITNYSHIIIDEAHERSLFTDLLLAKLKGFLTTTQHLRIIIASATIDPKIFCNYFKNAPLMTVPGRTYPVDIIYNENEDTTSSNDYLNDAIMKAYQIHRSEILGDILCFLATPQEVETACVKFQLKLNDESQEKNAIALPLHGKLQPYDQKKVFDASDDRKIVFATNLAETSVTIPGIVFVIDSGMVKERSFDAKKNINILDIKPISKSSAIQRAGRAGRIQAGICYRLYSKEEFDLKDDSNLPEILRINLGLASLKLLEMGEDNIEEFDFVQRPSQEAIKGALDELKILEALDTKEVMEPFKDSVNFKDDMNTLSSDEPVNSIKSDQESQTVTSTPNFISKIWSLVTNFHKKPSDAPDVSLSGNQNPIQSCSYSKPTCIKVIRTTLSDLGRKMAKLPTEPRLSKLIIDGIGANCGKEATILASLASSPGIVFFRAGSDEEKIMSDKLKIQFCQEEGDLITQLEVYKEWISIPEKQKNNWCLKNSLNAKTLRAVHQTYKDIIHVLRTNDFGYKDIFSSETDVKVVLSHLILGAFCNNLSIYSGHPKAGYIVQRLRECVYIHPSSALHQMGQTPRWVVFGEILRTSKDYITSVTPIHIELLEKYAPSYAAKANLKILEMSTVVPFSITGFGPQVLRQLIGCKGETVKLFQKQLSGDLGIICKIEIDLQRSSVDVYVPLSSHDHCRHTLENYLQKVDHQFSTDHEEIPVTQNSDTSMVLRTGGSVSEFLMASEYIQVEIFCESIEKIGADFEKLLESTTDLLCFRESANIVKNGKQRLGQAVFSSVKAAEQAVQLHNKIKFLDSEISIQPRRHNGNGKNANPRDTRLEVSWIRRRCKGIAFITCNDDIEAQRLMGDLSGRNGLSTSIAKPKNATDKEYQKKVFVRGSTQLLCRDYLEEAVRQHSVIRPMDYFVVYEKNGPAVDLKSEELQLYELFQQYAKNGTLKLNIMPSKTPNPLNGYAFVFLSNNMEAMNAIVRLNKTAVMGTQNISVKFSLNHSIPVFKDVFNILSDDLDKVIEVLNTKNTQTTIRIKKKNNIKINNKIFIDIEGKDLPEVARTISLINEVLKPHIISFGTTIYPGFYEMLEHLKVQHKDCKLQIDKRTNEILLFGKPEKCLAVKRDIENAIANREIQSFTTIELKGVGLPLGLMRYVLLKYGLSLEKLKTITDAHTLTLDIKFHQLKMQEKFEIVDKVKKEIEICSNELNQQPCMNQPEKKVPECAICFCPIEGMAYMLLCCGHQFCIECIQSQIETAIKNQEFPISCVTQNCGKRLYLKDLHNLVPHPQFQEMTSKSVNSFISNCEGKYKFCPTPDCPSVYRVINPEDGEGLIFHCCLCHKRICTRCQVDMHDGISCQNYELYKDDPDNTLRKWMETQKDVKNCPNCNHVIQKNGGCNHVACRCGIHICWICLASFERSDLCYNHMGHCRDV